MFTVFSSSFIITPVQPRVFEQQTIFTKFGRIQFFASHVKISNIINIEETLAWFLNCFNFDFEAIGKTCQLRSKSKIHFENIIRLLDMTPCNEMRMCVDYFGIHNWTRFFVNVPSNTRYKCSVGQKTCIQTIQEDAIVEVYYYWNGRIKINGPSKETCSLAFEIFSACIENYKKSYQ
jgi:hypothetical protein